MESLLVSFNGIGEDIYALPRETRKRVTLIFWIIQKFWPLSQLCVKVSIIILLRQLLGIFGRVRLATTILLVFTVAWSITAIVADTLQCLPVRYFWIKSIDGYCISGQAALFISIGALSLLEDIVLVVVPVAVVWRLKLARPQKIQITLLFSAGVITCVFSLLRLVEFPNYKTGNLTQSGTLETIYTLVELFLAIMCASVVLMRPAVQLCLRGCGCFPRHGLHEKPSSPSSDFAHLFPEFVYGTNFNTCSQDAYSEVRAQAYRTPTLEISQNRSDLAVHGIVVETSIDRDVRDREAILATIGDMGSIGRSTFGGSVRTGSVGSLHK
ncbi:hypothetical protein ATEIFO6365_0009015800 [Aspergillus terreus]|uniref:Rhodopsin domain-containing protein n=1 Tax=Aspergillus terreus TaxID=33178 RepID=A0A5M3Z7N8_ASPTE|nr:hypothetical protein ATETN484_0011015800 [Aspergillus terreus]GFF18795.1 hypothetical protein ATEIFO6365_0009015800 [Aspergillus terreus]